VSGILANWGQQEEEERSAAYAQARAKKKSKQPTPPPGETREGTGNRCWTSEDEVFRRILHLWIRI